MNRLNILLISIENFVVPCKEQSFFIDKYNNMDLEFFNWQAVISNSFYKLYIFGLKKKTDY